MLPFTTPYRMPSFKLLLLQSSVVKYVRSTFWETTVVFLPLLGSPTWCSGTSSHKKASSIPILFCSRSKILTLIYQVRWHHRSAHPITAVVSHPRDEHFAVFYSRPPSSTVSIFDPSGNSPRNTYTLPFTIRNIIWYPRLPSKAKETSTFHLVGITDNWDVVFCGDDVHRPAEEGSVARGLVASSQEPHKRTLLQDIFGDSALAGAPVGPLVQKTTSTIPSNGKEIMDILGGPAYLIPPLETLFEPLMTHFLTPRTSADETVPGLPTGDEVDVSMDVDESEDKPLVSGTRTERVVDAREMDALIELFRHHGVKGK